MTKPLMELKLSDTVLPSVTAKRALRDLQNETRSSIPAQTRGVLADAIKAFGNKKQKPNDSLTFNEDVNKFSDNTNENLLFDPKKWEVESAKLDSGDRAEIIRFDSKIQVPHPQHNHLEVKTNLSSTVSKVINPSNGHSILHSTGTPFRGMTTALVKPQAVHNLHWKDRFLSLQAFLKNCDQSKMEERIQMLRSLSASGRSKYAVELEKRAFNLLVEEGKELYRMNALNVLGTSESTNSLSAELLHHSQQNVLEKCQDGTHK